MPKQNRGRYILAAGAAAQLLTGIPAAWGVFQKPVMQGYGFSRGQAMLGFAVLVAAYGVGCTRWEVIRNVVIPYTRVGVVGGVMLGLGRALGETMAVTFVVGNANRISASILQPGTTISATIANEFTEATGDTHVGSLIALGLILFLITFTVLAISRLMLMRVAKASGA